MAVLAGDRLRGTAGAAAAIAGLCLPGGSIMFVIGMLHSQHAERAFATAMLHGVAAAAVGLVMAVAVQLGRKVVTRIDDLAFVALAVIGVNVLHLSGPRGAGVGWARRHLVAPAARGVTPPPEADDPASRRSSGSSRTCRS